MEKILGFDLGTNSIGWSIRNTGVEGNQNIISGVLTFKKGVGIDKTGEYSYAAQRTKKRSTRRLYQARKYRLWSTLDVLINEGYCPMKMESLDNWRKYDKTEALKNNNAGRYYPVNDMELNSWIKLDFDMDGKPDYSSPYQLRKELSEQLLDFSLDLNKFKLGRALYHIAQRRGFKSSRKSTEENKKESETDGVDLQISEKKKNESLIKLFEKYPNAKTIGSLFAYLELEKIRIREENTKDVIRENYKDEIKYIFEFQGISFDSELYKGLVEKSKNKNDGAIFFRRPLRSQKGLIGKCTLEINKYRAPISHPDFEFFRAWSLINNIKYKDADSWKSITYDSKKNVYEKLFLRKSKNYFLFSEIIEFLRKEKKDIVLNYSPKTTVSGCPITARLRDIFGNQLNEVKIEKNTNEGSKKNYYTIEDIWHILFSCEDSEFVEEFARLNLKLDIEKTKDFLKTWNSVPVGYAMLSLNAIRKINDFLEKGHIYTEAVLLANIPNVIGRELWNENSEIILNEITTIIELNRFQKSILNITNNLIANYKNLDFQSQSRADDYILNKDDEKDIYSVCESFFGKLTWERKNESDKSIVFNHVKNCYQAFFKKSGFVRKDFDGDRFLLVKSGDINFYKSDSGFFKLPKLKDSLAEFINSNFSISEEKLKKIYHPSEINIYPRAKEDKKDGIIKLGSPKTGSFKNPMAMRTLHELKKIGNYLIETKQIDTDTRVVVEVARELNDSNKRWAIETWQKRREEENKEFAIAIEELLNHNVGLKADKNSNDDIDKIRLWTEQSTEEQNDIPEVVENKREVKGILWQSSKNDSFKKIQATKEQVEKYRLWLEQEYTCMFTGRIIKISDLFNENVTDFEHTIPRSKSFDNSLANLTVCYSYYNRNIKKNQIPFNLPNYSEIWRHNGETYTAIEPRLEKWIDRIERIKQQIEFWKGKSKRASIKEKKDEAIRQRHLWQMDLDYWYNKVSRFTMKEITSGFVNSQLVDTQLISKYAFHYLKTYFDKVDVQKGSVTASFRKIFNLQDSDEKKNRSQHSHHAKDAAVLTLIPIAKKRDEILKAYFEHLESNQHYTIEPYKGFKREFIIGIGESILINNVAKNQTLSPAKRKIRKRGKEQFINGTNQPMIATGDCIRGQLHDETFLGAIRLGKKDENGKLLKDKNGNFIQEEKTRFVVRVPLKFKNGVSDSGFKSLDEIEKVIVDKHLFIQIKEQVEKADNSLQKALEKGIYMYNGEGKKENKIRHIRIEKTVTEPLKIKKQTYLSKHEYKQHYYAGNATNPYYALYQGIVKNKIERKFEIINLFDAAKLKNNGKLKIDDYYVYYDKKETIKLPLYEVLSIGQKVLFFKESPEELSEMNTNEKSNRLYVITGFEKDGRIKFIFHKEAREDKKLSEDFPKKGIDESGKEFGESGKNGFSFLNWNNPWPKLKISIGNLNILIEGKDLEIKPDGRIELK